MAADPAPEEIEDFIGYWQGREGGQERANYQLFLIGLCDLLGLPRPDAAEATRERNDYVFERAVDFKEPDGTMSVGRIDLYRRGCFVLEAKQSRQKGGEKAIPVLLAAPPPATWKQKAVGAGRHLAVGTCSWSMRASRPRTTPRRCRRAMAGRRFSSSAMSGIVSRSSRISRAREKTMFSFPIARDSAFTSKTCDAQRSAIALSKFGMIRDRSTQPARARASREASRSVWRRCRRRLRRPSIPPRRWRCFSCAVSSRCLPRT